MTHPFDSLREAPATQEFTDEPDPLKQYQLIMADPPWNFKARTDKGVTERAAAHHYDVQDLEWIKNLPVRDIVSPDGCVLMLWVTDTHLFQAQEVIKSWGFTYSTIGFHWAKLNKKSDGFAVGMGFYTRANPEICLLCRTKKIPKVLDHGIRRLIAEEDPRQIVSRLREHSRKPDEAYERAAALFGDVRRLEMFSRESREGWDSWGNQTGKFDADLQIDRDLDDLLG